MVLEEQEAEDLVKQLYAVLSMRNTRISDSSDNTKCNMFTSFISPLTLT